MIDCNRYWNLLERYEAAHLQYCTLHILRRNFQRAVRYVNFILKYLKQTTN